MKLILAGSVGLLAYLGWRSLGWPLIHDAPLMHYIAWLITQGAVPYRDAFDMNVPGVYLAHLAVLAVGGSGDWPWRLFDLGWLAATCGLLYGYCRPMTTRWAAAAGAALFALYHLSGGAWRAGQRDFLLGAFLLAGAWGVARSIEQGGLPRPLFWGGLALGAGMTVKPHAALYWAICAGAAAWAWRRRGRPVWLAPGTVLGAGLLVPALVFGWLGWLGGLRPFIEILTGYVLPLYSHVGRAPALQSLRWYEYGWELWLLFLALGALAMLSPAPRGFAARKALAVLGAAYGWLHFALQGKGWEYQLYPLALFLCALASTAVARVNRNPWPANLVAFEYRRALAVALWAVLVVVLGVKGVDALGAPWIAAKERRAAAVTRELGRLVPPGATAQVMDVTEGGIHALLNLRVRQPTRFLYDFHFFHDAADPRVQALRAEFAAALEAGRPAAIVVFRDTWSRPGYDRLRELPAVSRLLGRAYGLAVDGDGYRIYVRRTHEKRSDS